MDSLSFENLRHVLVLACTIVFTNVLFVARPDNIPMREAEIYTCYSGTEQHLEANLKPRNSSPMVTSLTQHATKVKSERDHPEHPFVVAVRSLTCSSLKNHY